VNKKEAEKLCQLAPETGCHQHDTVTN